MNRIAQCIRCVLAVALLLSIPLARGDQAKYVYDELGRLVGVIDGQGNVAVYNYDEVGNLLSIERFTAETSGIGVFLVAPASGAVGAEVQVQGFGFSTTPGDNHAAQGGVRS